MNFQSRLIWVAVVDLPQLIDKKIAFSCGARAYDPDYVVVQLYNNDAVKELDQTVPALDWQYPQVVNNR